MLGIIWKTSCHYYEIKNKKPKIYFPIIYKINNEYCFGFLCEIKLAEIKKPEKAIILKLQSKTNLKVNDFNTENLRFKIIYEDSTKKIYLKPSKRKIYIDSDLGIVVIEILKNDKFYSLEGLGYSSFMKIELNNNETFFLKLGELKEHVPKVIQVYNCTIHELNDNLIYSCNVKDPLIGNPLIIEINNKLMIIGIHNKTNKNEKNGILFKNFISPYLQILGKNDEKPFLTEPFCENFFLASFPTKNYEIMEKSHEYLADCEHTECSKYLAIKPEVIYKYPPKDINDFELNNLCASVCFPKGIKICYGQNKKNIKIPKNFRTIFSDKHGEFFFACTYYFYFKLQKENYEDYKNIITATKNQSYTNQNELLCDNCEEKLKKEIKPKDLDNVYIPYCLCLISRYPFYEQIEKCLESIMITIKKDHNNPAKLNQLINYIVNSIPLPPIHSTVSFPLPYLNNMCEIHWPIDEKILQIGNDPLLILDHLSINNIILFFKLLIWEQRILVVGKDNDIISKIILNFISLLYPMDYCYPIIPILGEKLLKYLLGFLPFLYGMNINLLKALEFMFKGPFTDFFIINIDDNSIRLITYDELCFGKYKYEDANAYMNKNSINLPHNIENFLLEKLKSIENEYKKDRGYIDNRTDINIRIKYLFIHIFVEMFFDYKNFSHTILDYPKFDSELFCEHKRKKEELMFYHEITQTQMFVDIIIDHFDKNIYFEELCDQYLKLKEKDKKQEKIFSELYNNFKNKYLSFSKIDTNHKINLKVEKSENRNKLIDIDYSWIFNKYELDKNYFNDKGILKEEQRIIEHKIKLIQKNDPKYSLKFQLGAFKTLSNILETDKKNKVDLKKKLVDINKNNIQKEVVDKNKELFDKNKNNIVGLEKKGVDINKNNIQKEVIYKKEELDDNMKKKIADIERELNRGKIKKNNKRKLLFDMGKDKSDINKNDIKKELDDKSKININKEKDDINKNDMKKIDDINKININKKTDDINKNDMKKIDDINKININKEMDDINKKKKKDNEKKKEFDDMNKFYSEKIDDINKEILKSNIDVMDEIKDDIRDLIAGFLNYDEYTKDREEILKKITKIDYGRKIFIDSITLMYKRDHSIKFLHKIGFDSFEAIFESIINILLEKIKSTKDDENIKYLAKLIKKSLYIVEYENKTLLFDKIIKNIQKDSLKNMFRIFEFTKTWFENGLTETDLKLLEILKKDEIEYKIIQADKNYLEYKNHCLDIIDKLKSAMKKLNISQISELIISKLKKEYYIDLKYKEFKE